MRFLFDQNISHRILDKLPDLFEGSTSVKKEGLINAPDKTIWDFAKKENFVIVTQDSDFSALTTLYGFPPKIIWIRFGNLKTDKIVDIITKNQNSIQDFLKDENLGCFEIFSLTLK